MTNILLLCRQTGKQALTFTRGACYTETGKRKQHAAISETPVVATTQQLNGLRPWSG